MEFDAGRVAFWHRIDFDSAVVTEAVSDDMCKLQISVSQSLSKQVLSLALIDRKCLIRFYETYTVVNQISYFETFEWGHIRRPKNKETKSNFIKMLR